LFNWVADDIYNQRLAEDFHQSKYSTDNDFEEVKAQITAYNEMLETPRNVEPEPVIVLPTPLPKLDDISDTDSEIK
jgi:hypothetical protein